MEKSKEKLVIVESPSKAKTITKYLEGSYKVLASVGHIRDLPKSNKKAIDMKNGFLPYYEIVKGKESIVKELKSEAKKAGEVIIATDPDREGEAIAWHISELCELKEAKRILFHEITKEAINDALNNPRTIDMNLKSAQEARRVLDRLFGYDLSGLIWKKLRYGLSAGRVQSPALRIVMEREKEIRAFISEKFWIITAQLMTQSNHEVLFSCSEEPRDIESVNKILESGKKNEWSVTEVKESLAKQYPRPPFITSTLEQTANSRFGWSPSKTMVIAQKLYEAGLISYMRTDSTIISKSAQMAIVEKIEKEFGKEYTEPRQFKTKKKSAQEAHEAIRPSDPRKKEAGAVADERKLYSLIWARAISSQMRPAEVMRTRIKANVKSKDIPDFKALGSRVIFPGWYKADPYAKKEDSILPEIKNGEDLKLIKIESEEKSTTPPNRYSEAGLIKELEKREIGRPSTYASIIKTLVDRGYCEKNGRTLFPTDTGEVVNDFLEKYFKKYISDSFTAEMEEELDEIAEGKRKYTKTLKDFYSPFSKAVKSKEDIEKITTLGKDLNDNKCPICGSGMVVKLGRSGKFLSCDKFPKCTGARTIDGKEMSGPKETGEKCPECETGNLVEKEGKYGKFIACSNYPKCKFVKNENSENGGLEGTGVKCPACGKGEMVKRMGKFGEFYSCSGYPSCKNAIKSRPTGNTCDFKKDNGKICGALKMLGTKTIPERCSDKTCPNHNPHKLDK